MRLVVPQSAAGFPEDLYVTPARNRALCDFLTREMAACCEERSARVGTGGGGVISIDRPGQEVLERTSVNVSYREVEARFTVGLPAAGRRVLGRKAAAILLEREVVEQPDVSAHASRRLATFQRSLAKALQAAHLESVQELRVG